LTRCKYKRSVLCRTRD